MPTTAGADTLTVNQDAQLHERSGESSKVVGSVSEGDKVIVITRSGRWIKVRTEGKDGVVGWLTRSNVDEKIVPRNTRRRPSLDGNSAWTQKYDRVGGDVVSEAERLRQEKHDRREARGRDGDVRRSDRDHGGDENDDSDRPGTLEECRDNAETLDDYDDCEYRTARRKKTALKKGTFLLAAQAGLGFTSVASNFLSNGTGDLAAYKLGSSAIAFRAAGSARYATSPTLAIGAKFNYDLARSTPGVRYSDGTHTVNIPFSIHRVTVGATVANYFGGIAVSGLLGFRFERFVISDVGDAQQNLAKLPTEVFSGAVLGAELALPKLTDTIGGAIAANLLLAGSRKQTSGLEDGQVSGAGGFDVCLRGTYQLKNMQIVGGYTFDRRNTNWEGAAAGSMRGHNATSATRADTWQTITVGIAAQF